MLVAHFERAAQPSSGSSCALRGFCSPLSPDLFQLTMAPSLHLVIPEHCSWGSASSHFCDKAFLGNLSGANKQYLL